MKLTTRQVQLAAVPKLLPPPEMSRGIQFTVARKVQGRMLARPGQRDGRVLVSSFAVVHTALGDNNRARRTLRLTRCLVRHSSPVPWVNGPRKAIPQGAARWIATLACATAAILSHFPHLLAAFAIQFTQRHGRCGSLQSKSCFRRRKCPAACSISPRATCKGGSWPRWSSAAAISWREHLIVCTRRSQLKTRARHTSGLRGA